VAGRLTAKAGWLQEEVPFESLLFYPVKANPIAHLMINTFSESGSALRIPKDKIYRETSNLPIVQESNAHIAFTCPAITTEHCVQIQQGIAKHKFVEV
jgi:hypothetical protein